MKCPLKFKLEEITSTQDRFYNDDCLKEECAWWGTYTVDKSTEATGCCITILPEILSVIMDKMPHLEQFKRA